MLLLLLPVMLLSAHAGDDAGPLRTFKNTDPVTGRQVECDACPPGTYLRARCTQKTSSECATCAPGSFTEVWNNVGECQRCRVCGFNQVERMACSTRTDCQCECEPGHHYKKEYEACLRHGECPLGRGVVTRGTAKEDTVCRDCTNDTFSDTVSAQQHCAEHRSCGAAGQQLLLKGSTWHDSVCVSCDELQDGASYLKEILPVFFLHQNMAVRRLRWILRNLPSKIDKEQEGISELNLSEVHTQVIKWLTSAGAKQIRQLPAILKKAGAHSAGKRLKNKLQKIDSKLKELCELLGNEVNVV